MIVRISYVWKIKQLLCSQCRRKYMYIRANTNCSCIRCHTTLIFCVSIKAIVCIDRCGTVQPQINSLKEGLLTNILNLMPLVICLYSYVWIGQIGYNCMYGVIYFIVKRSIVFTSREYLLKENFIHKCIRVTHLFQKVVDK